MTILLEIYAFHITLDCYLSLEIHENCSGNTVVLKRALEILNVAEVFQTYAGVLDFTVKRRFAKNIGNFTFCNQQRNTNDY